MNSFVELFKEKIQTKGKLTAKQQDILAACVDLFAEKGFSNTSTSDIATRASVAEGTIFKHFGTKQNLLFVTILPIFADVVFDQLVGLVAEEKADTDERSLVPFEELIHQILFTRINSSHDNDKLIKIFVSELLYQESLQQELLNLIPDKLIHQVNQMLDYYKQDQQIAVWDNHTIIRFILAPILSYIMMRHSLLRLTPEAETEELQRIKAFITKGLAY